MPIASYSEAYDLIHDYFKTAWDANPNVENIPISWDDLRFNPPDDEAWIKFIVDYNNSRQATVGGSLGNRRFTRYGLITIQIFTKVNDGRTQADELAQFITDIFEDGNPSLDKVYFRDCDRHDIGISGRWYQTNIIVRFQFDQVK